MGPWCPGACRSLRASRPRGPAAVPTTTGGSRRNRVVTHQWRPAHCPSKGWHCIQNHANSRVGRLTITVARTGDNETLVTVASPQGNEGSMSSHSNPAVSWLKRPLANGLAESRDQYGDGRKRRSRIAPVGEHEIVDRGERRRAIDRQLRIKCRRTRRARR